MSLPPTYLNFLSLISFFVNPTHLITQLHYVLFSHPTKSTLLIPLGEATKCHHSNEGDGVGKECCYWIQSLSPREETLMEEFQISASWKREDVFNYRLCHHTWQAIKCGPSDPCTKAIIAFQQHRVNEGWKC